MTVTELDDIARRLEAQCGLTDPGCGLVVLLAHPDPVARVELDRHLTNRGFQVFAAGSATEAMWEGLAHAGSLVALVCDPGLPGLPPAELYRRLRVTIPSLRLCLLAPGPAGPGAGGLSSHQTDDGGRSVCGPSAAPGECDRAVFFCCRNLLRSNPTGCHGKACDLQRGRLFKC